MIETTEYYGGLYPSPRDPELRDESNPTPSDDFWDEDYYMEEIYERSGENE